VEGFCLANETRSVHHVYMEVVSID